MSAFDWAQGRLRKVFDKEYAQLNDKQKIQKQLEQTQSIISTLESNQQSTDKALESLLSKIDMLIESDRDDIKSYITKEHHYFCYQKGWIDDFSLDCIERRYRHYEEQGGNSFVKNLMSDLRRLPRENPNTK